MEVKEQLRHLVLVEDNFNLCTLVKSYFGSNFRVSTFRDGEGCLANLEEIKDAHVVILDYQLVHMNGIELFLALQPYLPHAKFILTTGYLEPPLAEEGARLGFHGLILKPFDFSILESNINRLLEDHGSTT